VVTRASSNATSPPISARNCCRDALAADRRRRYGRARLHPRLPKVPSSPLPASSCCSPRACQAPERQRRRVIEVADPGALPAATARKTRRPPSPTHRRSAQTRRTLTRSRLCPVGLVDVQQGGQLLARVKALRSSLAVQLGFIVPPIHITDNVRLKPREYVISLRGVEIARWEMLEDKSSPLAPTQPAPAGRNADREPAFASPRFGLTGPWNRRR